MRFVDESDVTSVPADPGSFSAGVQVSAILPVITADGMRANRFVYPPGARSHWHTHDGEQALYVVAGRGVVQREGEDVGRLVLPGSWVHVEPGERHWHGAVHDDVLVHVAVTATGGTAWGDPVTEQDYDAAQRWQPSGPPAGER